MCSGSTPKSSLPAAPMPTVPLAAEAIGCTVEQIIKTVVFATQDGQAVIAIANGTRRIDRRRLADAVGVTSLKLADPRIRPRNDRLSGRRCRRRSASASTSAPMIVDTAVLDQESVYGGAGTEDDLLHIATDDLIGVTRGRSMPNHARRISRYLRIWPIIDRPAR